MPYVDGFVVPVPNANRDSYVEMARKAWEVFQRHGAVSMVECWGDDVPDGKLTDFRRAVQCKPDETVVFSWVTWPDRAARDRGNKAMMEDPAMKDMSEMPFDGKRMIYGGFAPVFQSEAKR